jgi:hypothetical protein
MMRAFLGFAALAMLAWIVTGTMLWLGEYGDPVTAFSSFWTTLHSDWMVLVLVTDLLMFTIAAFVWVAMDLRTHGAPPTQIVAWLALMLCLGSVVLFVYLARRAPPSVSAPATA